MERMTYQEADAAYIGLIKYKAGSWSKSGAGDYDDLVQEGRCTLLKAIESYDEARGPLIKYLGVLLDNRYRSLRSAALAQVRIPHIWEKDIISGKWKRVPYAEISLSAFRGHSGTGRDVWLFGLDALLEGRRNDLGADQTVLGAVSDWQTPCDNLLDREARVVIAKWRQTLEARLRPRQLEVYQCLIRPTSGLLAVARNLSCAKNGSHRVTIPHVAAYLGITKNQVDHAIYGIREMAKELFVETDSTTAELIRRALWITPSSIS